MPLFLPIRASLIKLTIQIEVIYIMKNDFMAYNLEIQFR